jgi:guanylate kinase
MNRQQKNNLSIVVSAPSGAGKTTIINRLLSEDNKCEFVISTTTRLPRDGEVNGQSYYFTSIDDFKQKIQNDELIEWSLVHKNYYGITKKEFDRIISIGKIPLFDVDVQGAEKLQKILTGAVFIFIIPPSMDILSKRLRNRGTDTEEQINIRIKNALKELNKAKNYDYIIINNGLDESVSDFKAILRAELCRTRTVPADYFKF